METETRLVSNCCKVDARAKEVGQRAQEKPGRCLAAGALVNLAGFGASGRPGQGGKPIITE